jgi:hypothetical protein
VLVEAALGAGLVHWPLKSCRKDVIFVTPPRRIQRLTVREASRSMCTFGNGVDALMQSMANLAIHQGGTSPVTVDAVERL